LAFFYSFSTCQFYLWALPRPFFGGGAAAVLQRCCNIVAHVHDELIIEADRQMSLKSVCEQMERTPPWAGDLLLRVDGYETEFYKKD